MAVTRKIKRSVTLDGPLVEAIEASGADNLSAVLNAALRAHLAVQRQHAALGDWLARLADEEGPVDERDVDEFTRLLGGPADTAAAS